MKSGYDIEESVSKAAWVDWEKKLQSWESEESEDPQKIFRINGIGAKKDLKAVLV